MLIIQVQCDFPGVRVYADNQVVANTDSKGRALIPRLRPYQKNSIRIEQADLPMDAQIDSVELDLVPYFRSGLVAKFPVKQQQQGLIKVVSENGKPIPAGAVAYFIPENLEFPVGPPKPGFQGLRVATKRSRYLHAHQRSTGNAAHFYLAGKR